jgi:release factor glutamine methyltransferase
MTAPPSLAAADLVAWAEAALRTDSESPGLDAELLLAASTGLGRAQILARPERQVGDAAAERFSAFVARRRGGEPVAYIVGRREFYSLDLTVSSAVLVPRPDTELLVETALAQSPPIDGSAVDLGTGSGAIALALKQGRPDLRVTGVDASPEALRVAHDNAERLGLSVRLIESSWFTALGGERFDLVIANPPYVCSDDAAFTGGLRHEPRAALDGGADGLDAYRSILAAAADHLQPGGKLLFEHGAEQRAALIALSAAAGFEVVSVHDDLAGLPRVLVLAGTTRS